jgi:hypothetical protein
VGFNLAGYEQVADRLARAHNDHPDLRVVTELTHHDASIVIVRAVLYRTGDDFAGGRIWTTGWAQETIGSNNINRDSWLENCETSAIGRALANANYAPHAARPSREEMAKIARRADTRAEIRARVARLDREARVTFTGLFGNSPATITDLDGAVAWLEEHDA